MVITHEAFSPLVSQRKMKASSFMISQIVQTILACNTFIIFMHIPLSCPQASHGNAQGQLPAWKRHMIGLMSRNTEAEIGLHVQS